MTNADRMTTASSSARRTGYSRIGDRMTAVSDGGDMGPSLMPMGSMSRDDVGDDWEEQQRRWAGGRAPVATGPRSVDDFSDIEEEAAGVQGDRYACALAKTQRPCAWWNTAVSRMCAGARPHTGTHVLTCICRCPPAYITRGQADAGASSSPYNSYPSTRTRVWVLVFCVCCSYGYAGASSTRGGAPAGSTAGGNFPTGPGVPHDGSRDSTSSVGSRASTRFLDLRCVV